MVACNSRNNVINDLKSTTEAIASIYLFFLLVLYFPSLEVCNLVFQDPPLFLNLLLLLGDSDLHVIEAGIKLELQEPMKKKILHSMVLYYLIAYKPGTLALPVGKIYGRGSPPLWCLVKHHLVFQMVC